MFSKYQQSVSECRKGEVRYSAHHWGNVAIMGWDLMWLIFIDCQFYKRHSGESSFSFQRCMLHPWASARRVFADLCSSFLSHSVMNRFLLSERSLNTLCPQSAGPEFSVTFWFEHSFLSCDQCVKILWNGSCSLLPISAFNLAPLFLEVADGSKAVCWEGLGRLDPALMCIL